MKELLSGLIGRVTDIITKVMTNGDDAINLAHEISTTVQHALESRLSTEHWAEGYSHYPITLSPFVISIYNIAAR
ncbi:hypothetical protein N9L40_02180 [Rhodobacteraceae bacterium]|nr:hypothetical protein [Paracoccaceae bacterium]